MPGKERCDFDDVTLVDEDLRRLLVRVFDFLRAGSKVRVPATSCAASDYMDVTLV